MEYQHKNTSVSVVNYHIVFCPKYRRKLLVSKIKVRLEEIIRDVALENGWEIISREVMPDHVHLFVGADTRTSPEIVVKRFKGRSSRYLRNEFPFLSATSLIISSSRTFILPTNNFRLYLGQNTI